MRLSLGCVVAVHCCMCVATILLFACCYPLLLLLTPAALVSLLVVLQSYKATGSVDSVKVMVGQGADLQANTVPGAQYDQQGSKNPTGMLAS